MTKRKDWEGTLREASSELGLKMAEVRSLQTQVNTVKNRRDLVDELKGKAEIRVTACETGAIMFEFAGSNISTEARNIVAKRLHKFFNDLMIEEIQEAEKRADAAERELWMSRLEKKNA